LSTLFDAAEPSDGSSLNRKKEKGRRDRIVRDRNHSGASVGLVPFDSSIQWATLCAVTREGGRMNIMIHLESDLISKTIYQLLITNAYDDVVVGARCPANRFTPDVLLVDITTLTHDLLAQYPQAKTFLIDDTGIEPEKLCATLLSYRMHGTFSPHGGLQQVWIDNGSVRALLHDTGALSKTGKSGRSPTGKRRSPDTCAVG
jgi:hypothetical protein